MKFKFRKRLKKTFAVLAAVMLAVCSMAFSVSADEVIYNGTITLDAELGGYEFPSYIPLTVGDTYSLTYNGVTDTGQVFGPVDDLPVPFVQFINLGMILFSGDIGNGNQTGIIWQAGNLPDSIDVILSKGASGGQSEDQVILQQNVRFENLAGSYSGAVVNPGFNFIPNREYLVEVNGISRQYTAIFSDDVGVVVGANPPADSEFTLGITEGGGINGGEPTLLINADNLITSAGTYPVKITLLGIKGPSFLGSVTDAIGSVLSWVGIPINEMLNDGGALTALLPLFGIGIVIAAVFVGIKIIRSFIWSA